MVAFLCGNEKKTINDNKFDTISCKYRMGGHEIIRRLGFGLTVTKCSSSDVPRGSSDFLLFRPRPTFSACFDRLITLTKRRVKKKKKMIDKKCMALVPLPFILFFASFASAFENRSSREPKFISFDSTGGKIDIDLDLSVPFLSIPLGNTEGVDGMPAPLLNVNTKAITVAGLMAAVAAFIIPLFFKSQPDRYRIDDDFGMWHMGNPVNELLLGNNYVTPCVQRAVCTVVAKVVRADHPTSNEKIIDGITSHKWFEDMTNGTAIQDAVTAGRESSRDCSIIYKKCSMPARLFQSLLVQFGAF